MGVTLTKSGKYNSEKMENQDTKKHSNMLCFNARSDSIVAEDTYQEKKRFSLKRFKRRSKNSENDELEGLRKEFDRVNRIRYDLESNKPIKLDESIENCGGLVGSHNGSIVINKASRSNSLEEEGKSKSVDCIYEKEKEDDGLSFLTVNSEIITASRRSSTDTRNEENSRIVSDSLNNLEEDNSSLTQIDDNGDNGAPEMDPTPPNSPQETTLDITYGTVLGEQNIKALKTKIQKEIDRKTSTISEGEEEDEENL